MYELILEMLKLYWSFEKLNIGYMASKSGGSEYEIYSLKGSY